MFFSRAQITSRRAAFTLIELLAVLSLLALLATIVLGVGRLASDASRAARAKTELAALSVALETYRREQGDYPRTDSAAVLLQSLLGRLTPEGATARSPARTLLDTERFWIAAPREPDVARDPFSDTAAVLMDPWGRSYRYAYKSTAGWSNPSFVLYSSGPDGVDTAALRPGGFVDAGAAANADNIYPP